MSEFSVHRTSGGDYCLILDGTRIAGGKPEFSRNNCVAWWKTDNNYGDVSSLRDENAKLRELLQRTWDIFHDATAKEFNDTKSKLRELGIEVLP